MRIRRRVNIFFARKMSHTKEKYYIKGTKITNKVDKEHKKEVK
jgi:hypothetical protein